MMRDIVINSIKKINKNLKNKDLEEVSDSDDLFAKLDSMAILDLVLEIESSIEQHYGYYLQIADDTIMDQDKSPFRTIEKLVIFLEKRNNSA